MFQGPLAFVELIPSAPCPRAHSSTLMHTPSSKNLCALICVSLPTRLAFSNLYFFWKRTLFWKQNTWIFHCSPATDGRVIPDKPISLYDMVQARNSQLGCTLDSHRKLSKSIFCCLGPTPESQFHLVWGRTQALRKAWQPTPVFLPGESHRHRSRVGYSPWGHKESDTMK